MTDFHQDGRAGIDAALVRRLIAQQFPQWADLPITPVKIDGWDNRTYRLGTDLTARLPTHSSYVAAVDKEHRWLPVLAPHLPAEIPEAVAKGSPGEGYPHPWAIRRWIPGATASVETVPDLDEFARAIAGFILALQSVDASDAPLAGAHSFYRGAPPEHYHDETLEALAALKGRIDTDHAREVWDAALAATWDRSPVWFHGDIASGNLLVRDGRLSAVIDFGTSGVGDPACDLVIAYTFFTGSSRSAFRDAVRQDDAMWARARGWALWKALITEDLPVIERVLEER
ncbi:aminoglycoside phosphotransferase family protein [Kribbella sp. NPDC054772]